MTRAIERRTVARALAIAAAVLLVAALVGLARVPTGAATAQGTVPQGRRLAMSAPVGPVRVMVLSASERLSLLVAYEGEKGWHGVPVEPAPPGAVAAWAATRGGGDVPALSAVYGRVAGERVQVRWSDGRTVTAIPGPDGVYLVARPGLVRSQHIAVLGADGSVLTEVAGP